MNQFLDQQSYRNRLKAQKSISYYIQKLLHEVQPFPLWSDKIKLYGIAVELVKDNYRKSQLDLTEGQSCELRVKAQTKDYVGYS